MRPPLPSPGSVLFTAARGGALFLAAFTVVGLVGELRGRTLDPSLWWVDLRDVLPAVRIVGLAAGAGLLAAWAVHPAPGRRLRVATAAVSIAFAALALRDVLRFGSAVAAGDVRPMLAVPLSAPVAVALAGIAAVAIRDARRAVGQPPVRRSAPRRALVLLVTAACWAVAFPLAQMLFFGTTDYRRPAAAAVVFGARVYASGQPSPLLADRIATGVELYRAGLVPRLVMSGGDGADGFNEARVMRDVAVAAGVDPADIMVDPVGVSTEATVTNVARLLGIRDGTTQSATSQLIAVSQAYHLPRVQLAFANAGIDVLTVPAADPEPIGEMPILIGREDVAFWAYYLRVCLG